MNAEDADHAALEERFSSGTHKSYGDEPYRPVEHSACREYRFESMNTEQRAVQVVRMGTLTVYEITDDELRLIEAGGPSSTFLNFGIGSMSLGLGIGTTLLAAGPVETRAVFDTLVILTIVGVLAGAVLLILWRQMAKRTTSTIAGVRERAGTQVATLTAATFTTSTTSEEAP